MSHKIFNSIHEFSCYIGGLKVIQSLNFVTTSGVFDLITRGHLHLLREASKLGGDLVVLLDSDERVKKLKGKERPVNNFDHRSEVLASLENVKYVIKFNDDSELSKCLFQLAPKYHVKDSSYLNKKVIGVNEVLCWKGNIVFIANKQSESTTDIIERIKKS